MNCRAVCFLVFASILLLPPVAVAENPPEELYSWEIDVPGGHIEWYQGSLYVSTAEGLRRFSGPTPSGTAAPGHVGSVGSVRGDGHVYAGGTGTHLINVLSPELQVLRSFGRRLPAPPEFVPYAMAHDAQGNLYVADGRDRRILMFDAQDDLILEWGSWGSAPGQFRGPECLAVTPGGEILVGDWENQRIDRFDAQGNHLGELLSEDVWTPVDITVDANGFIYVADYDRDYYVRQRVLKLDPQGNRIVEWHVPHVLSVAVDEDGYVYAAGRGYDIFANRGRIHKFDNEPGPDVPARFEHDPALALHVEELSDAFDCGKPDLVSADINTTGDVTVDGGLEYRVYILASPDTRETLNAGITGSQFGIEYVVDDPPGSGVEVLGWTRCSELEFADPDWPEAGTSNTLTWPIQPLKCQRRDLVILGYLDIAPHAPSAVRLRPFGSSGVAKISNCGGAETVVDVGLDPVRLGWVSLGGAAVGDEDSGCNPLARPCAESVSVEPTTWGALKRLLDGD